MQRNVSFRQMSAKNLGYLLAAMFCVLVGSFSAKADRPNIVFIIVDDLRADALSISGHPFLKTPHIDRIGREGAMFKNAFVTTPLCSPARGSFLTGKYVHNHGIKGNSSDYAAPSHKLVTFPGLLRESGYESAYIGKWHMGNDDSPRPGFDHWVSFKGQGVFNDPSLNINGTTKKAEGYISDILSEHAVEFVKREHTKPFVLYLSHKAVHGPFTPAPRHKGVFADKSQPAAPNVLDTLEGKPVLTREVQEKKPRRANAKKTQMATGRMPDGTIRGQLECMLSIDEGVGKLLQALEQIGQLDNTVLIFTSDNGYFWGEHGRGDKRWAYEESIRVPLLVRYPALVKAGSQPTEFALNIDIAPTVLDLAGAKLPKNFDGISLVPALRGKKTSRDHVFLEYYAEPNYPRHAGWQAVRSHRYKYIHYTELEGMNEFYDLAADPFEMKNLINDPKAAAALKDLKKKHNKFFGEIK